MVSGASSGPIGILFLPYPNPDQPSTPAVMLFHSVEFSALLNSITHTQGFTPQP